MNMETYVNGVGVIGGESGPTTYQFGRREDGLLEASEVAEPKVKAPAAHPHLNASRVRRTALEIAKQNRAHRFTRVGKAFLDRIEAATRAAIAREVRQHPSKGRTLL